MIHHHQPAPSRCFRNTLTQHADVSHASPPVDEDESAEVSCSRLRVVAVCSAAGSPYIYRRRLPKFFKKPLEKRRKEGKEEKGRRTAARHKSARLTNVVQPLCKETVMASDCCRGGERGGGGGGLSCRCELLLALIG